MTEAIFSIESEMAAVRPDYKPLARALLDEIRDFFTDPENEAAFQRWKAERDREGR